MYFNLAAPPLSCKGTPLFLAAVVVMFSASFICVQLCEPRRRISAFNPLDHLWWQQDSNGESLDIASNKEGWMSMTSWRHQFS